MGELDSQHPKSECLLPNGCSGHTASLGSLPSFAIPFQPGGDQEMITESFKGGCGTTAVRASCSRYHHESHLLLASRGMPVPGAC